MEKNERSATRRQSTFTYGTSSTGERLDDGSNVTSKSLSEGDAANILGGALVSRAQAIATRPDALSYFGSAIAHDIDTHPIAYQFKMVGLICAAVCEVPEAYEGAKAVAEFAHGAYDAAEAAHEVERIHEGEDPK